MSELIYRIEVAAKICSRMAEGESLSKICRGKDMPSKPTWFAWLSKHPDEIVPMYAMAQDCLAQHYFDEVIEISDDSSRDYIEKKDADGTVREVFNSEHVQRSRLRVDSRKWICARMNPRKYGDRISTELTGKDGGPVQMENAAAPTLADFYQTVKRIAVDTVKDTAKDDDGNSQV